VSKIAVMGAGAVGCYYGAMLARAGHRVTMIGRPAHVEAMRTNGLVLETSSFSEVLRVEATTEADGVEGADLVLFCVKSDDTLQAGKEIAPYLGPETAVISLQNGVDNAARLETVLGRPVTSAAVYVAVEMAGAGHVKHHERDPARAGADVAGTVHQRLNVGRERRVGLARIGEHAENRAETNYGRAGREHAARQKVASRDGWTMVELRQLVRQRLSSGRFSVSHGVGLM